MTLEHVSLRLAIYGWLEDLPDKGIEDVGDGGDVEGRRWAFLVDAPRGVVDGVDVLPGHVG